MRARQYKVQQYNDARFSSITCCTKFTFRPGSSCRQMKPIQPTLNAKTTLHVLRASEDAPSCSHLLLRPYENLQIRTENFISIGYLVAEILNVKVREINNFTTTFLFFSSFLSYIKYSCQYMAANYTTQPDSHYIRCTAANVLKRTTLSTPESHWLMCVW